MYAIRSYYADFREVDRHCHAHTRRGEGRAGEHPGRVFRHDTERRALRLVESKTTDMGRLTAAFHDDLGMLSYNFV